MAPLLDGQDRQQTLEVQGKLRCEGIRCLHGVQRGTELSQFERQDGDDLRVELCRIRCYRHHFWSFCWPLFHDVRNKEKTHQSIYDLELSR